MAQNHAVTLIDTGDELQQLSFSKTTAKGDARIVRGVSDLEVAGVRERRTLSLIATLIGLKKCYGTEK